MSQHPLTTPPRIPIHGEPRHTRSCAGSATDYCNAAPYTSIFGLWGDLSLELWPPDNDAALVFKVQSFLRCKLQGYPIAPSLQSVWEVFYHQHEHVVGQQVMAFDRLDGIRS